VAEGLDEAVCHELNLLTHEVAVHANQFALQTVVNKLLLDFDRLADDGVELLFREFVFNLLALE